MLGSGHPSHQSPLLAITFHSPMNFSQLPKPLVNTLLLFSPALPFTTRCSHRSPTRCQSRQPARPLRLLLAPLPPLFLPLLSDAFAKQTNPCCSARVRAAGRTRADGQDEESGYGASAVLSEAEEEEGQLEGAALTVAFQNVRSSYLASEAASSLCGVSSLRLSQCKPRSSPALPGGQEGQ